MTSLNNITLIAASDIKLAETLCSLNKSKQHLTFNKVKLFTSKPVKPDGSDIEVVRVDPITCSKDYSYFIMYNLYKHIDTDYVLITQHDGWVVNPDKWNTDFLNYDYIGAPWPSGKVGNGGFSLRTKRFLEYFNKNDKPYIPNNDNLYLEDSIITTMYYNDLIKDGYTFAPESLANSFSREVYYKNSVQYPFGFHSFRDANFIYLNR